MASLVAASLLFAGGAYALGVNASGEARQAEQNSQVVLVTATRIQEQTLETTDSFNGSVRLGTEYGVTVQPSDNMQSVVTRAPKGPGDSLTSGEIALEVSGRPLIALDLPFALYRDLHPGDTGPDVSALQTALAGLGVYGGKVDSIYGQQTAESVKRLYTQLGYAPPEPDAALIDAQHAAEAARIAITAETPPSEAEAVRVAAQAATFAALTPTSATEIVRLQGPSTVVSTATVGDFPTIDQAAMILRSGTPQAILRVNGVDVSNFSAGMTVMVAGVGSSDPPATSVVSSVGPYQDADPNSPESAPGHDVTITLPIERDWQQTQTVEVTVNGQSSTPGLAVPVSAIREDSRGKYVLLIAPEGINEETVALGDPETTRVDVTLAASDSRFAMVDGDLDLGDYVVVGQS